MRTLIEWWESISLRTKVTGITVSLLALGLLVSGIGTSILLKNYLIEQVDLRLTNASVEWESALGPNAVPDAEDVIGTGSSEFFWARFDASGEFIIDNWGSRDSRPEIDSFGLDETKALNGSIFTLNNVTATLADWRAIAVPIQSKLAPENEFTLVIALSLTRTENTMTNYLSIFFGFGVIVVVFGAALTRISVTSTFAPLRDVEATAAAIASGDLSLRMRNTNNTTEVGRLNRSLNTMLHRIDRVFAERARTIEQMRRFVGDASHELRTPLVTVRGYAELYRIGALSSEEEIGQAMDRIEKEAVRMGLLVEDLLQLARLDQTRKLEVGPVDLIPLVNDAALDAGAREPDRIVSVHVQPGLIPITELPDEPYEDATPYYDDEHPIEPEAKTSIMPAITKTQLEQHRQAKNKTGPITGSIAQVGEAFNKLRWRRKDSDTSSQEIPAPIAKKTEQPKLVVITAEENKIRQVITNLLGNALRFTPKDSPVELRVERLDESNEAQVSVVDHGEGVPPQIREKIFERFWRADTSRTRGTGGSGLGLAIVSAIVASHEGRVWVEETPGGGATFRVAFPLTQRDG